MTASLPELMYRYERFIDDRDWNQFHTPKNVSMAIAVEAAELMELFQWHDSLDPVEIQADQELVGRVEDELADVLLYCLSMAIQLELDPEELIERKLAHDEERFDTERASSIRSELERWQKGK